MQAIMKFKIVFCIFTICIPSAFSTNRVVNGQYSTRTSPLVAVLLSDIGTKYELYCGCGIFSEYYAVSAAHCLLEDNWPTTIGTNGLNIHRMGAYHKIVSKIWHPDYTGKNINNDIGLVKSETVLRSAHFINPIHDPPFSKDLKFWHKRQKIIYGWGATDEQGTVSDDLKHFALRGPISNLSPCSTDPAGIEGLFQCYLAINPNDQAGGGDSGSPLILKARFWFQRDRILGIVSGGNGAKPPVQLLANYNRYYPWLAETAK